MSSGALADRHAVVTGAGQGIGAAVARTLAGAGARVSLLGRRPAPLEGVASELTEAEAMPCDVTDEAAVVAAFDELAARRGPVEILVNNAGAAESALVEKTSLAQWNAMLAVNLTGAFLCSRAVLPAMKQAGFGRIVTIASTAGLKGYGYVAAYCAAKHGAVGLTRALALETAKSGITVNAVCPGFTETPLLARAVDTIVETTGRDATAGREMLVRDIPLGRLTAPEEVADAVLWLCRAESAAVTGQAVVVAGGEVMAG